MDLVRADQTSVRYKELIHISHLGTLTKTIIRTAIKRLQNDVHNKANNNIKTIKIQNSKIFPKLTTSGYINECTPQLIS